MRLNKLKIINEKYNFSFEIPDKYSAVSEEEYEDLNTDGSALYVFEAGEDLISLNYSGAASDFNAIIQENINSFKMIGVNLKEKIEEDNLCIIHLEFNPLKLVSIFVKVAKIIVVASIEVNEFNDNKENELKTIFKSFKPL